VRRYRLKNLLTLFLVVAFFLFTARSSEANCKDPELRQKVAQTAKEEGVDERELLSIIAHESSCRYYTVAWNRPGFPQTAKSRFLDSLEEAQILAEYLIATKNYRVDIGIGQINNEAHIQSKGWSLDEVLNPKTALTRVAQVLKERGWKNYHSSNPALAKRWQVLALTALAEALSKSQGKNLPIVAPTKTSNPLLVFNVSNPNRVKRNQKTDWVIYVDL
jgi:hypothetical protein